MFTALSRCRVVCYIPKRIISKAFFSSHGSTVLEAVPFQLTEKEAVEAYNKWVKRYTSFIFNKKIHLRVRLNFLYLIVNVFTILVF